MPVRPQNPGVGPRRHAFGAVVAIVASQIAFLLNDALIKIASETLPLGEIIFVRGLFAAGFVGAVAFARGLHRQIRVVAHAAVAWRSFGELGGTAFYLIALFNMPIANATIIFQALPLVVTAAAALLLGESVGWRRWAAILVGFLGVLLVVRPGLSGFDAFGLLVLVSVLFVALRDLATRAMPAEIPTLLVTLAAAVVVCGMGFLLGLAESWAMPSPRLFLALAGAGLFLAVGYFTAIAAMQLGEVSLTAPFRYVAIVFAVLLGVLIWDDVPDAATLLGSVIIMSAGLYTLYRERKAHGRAAALAAARTPTGG
jgi:drug/metabolite transporter (DMT)-like permease